MEQLHALGEPVSSLPVAVLGLILGLAGGLSLPTILTLKMATANASLMVAVVGMITST